MGGRAGSRVVSDIVATRKWQDSIKLYVREIDSEDMTWLRIWFYGDLWFW
jgi:hypothetical protein